MRVEAVDEAAVRAALGVLERAEWEHPLPPIVVLRADAAPARTPSVLAMAQIDDLTDEAYPVNVTATSGEHPNWRRRLSMTLEELATRPRFVDIAEIFRAERGAPQPKEPLHNA
jgi:4-alpha-glucanotransferase